MAKKKLTLYRDKDRFGISTTADTPEEFLREFAGSLSELVKSGYLNGDAQDVFSQWLTQGFEITAKLKGYKADVIEERVIYAGAAFADEKSAVAPKA